MKNKKNPDVETVADALPDNLMDLINNAIYDFMTYECKPPIDDMRKASAQLWSACCMYIGKTVFKENKLLYNADAVRQGVKKYNYDKVNVVIDIWLYYCGLYSKAPLIFNFYYFCGVNYSEWLKNDCAVTSDGIALKQRLSEAQQGGLSAILSDSRHNPTGIMALLRHFHGWENNTVTIQTETKTAIKAVDLPKIGLNEQF